MEEIEYGYIPLSDEEESKAIGWSVYKIKKYQKSLIEKGFLDIIEIDGKKVKRFNLTKLKLGITNEEI